MISIIISSINTEQNIFFKKDIEETISVPYELLIHYNRKKQQIPFGAHACYKEDKLNFRKPFIPQLNKIDTL
ncbi:hypothetical protein [uncultured Parabacteroides sp.]|uniref:hypothetical protein n=1 Tax=uncultured Parabacteroides sp. TaxID=512312 RepID=UPI001897FC1C|nr:hypothetical protein [uncultured Parabacteroides sp.]